MGFQSGRSGGVGNGRTALNPQGCKKVTRKKVLDTANEMGIEIQRDGKGMWYFKDKDGWYTLGLTNYVALYFLKNKVNKD